MSGALQGIRVVEFANYVSGPYAGMLLGDLGAEVVKVEEPTRGDPFRGWGRVEYSPTFGSVNRNKKSVTLDLKSESGKADARALVRSADVVIENFRPGAMERLGLSYNSFSTDQPGLIWCAITGFGTDGPYAQRPGYDTVGVASSGLLSLLTDIGDPKPMGISLSDHLAGITACNGVMARAYRAGPHWKGPARRNIPCSKSTLSFCGENAARYFENGKVPSRATRTHQAQVYAFTASDGKAFVIHLSSPNKVLEGAGRGRRQAGMARRPAFRNERNPRQDITTRSMSNCRRSSALNTRAWLEKLQGADVPAAPLNTFDDVFSDPQVQHLGMRVDIAHPVLGSRRSGSQRSAPVGNTGRSTQLFAGAGRTQRRNFGPASGQGLKSSQRKGDEP